MMKLSLQPMLTSSPKSIYLNKANNCKRGCLQWQKSKNFIAFKYICFMNGMVKSGLQILVVNDLNGEFKASE
jgi:hypothetical protein